jgi:hypothetical protein
VDCLAGALAVLVAAPAIVWAETTTYVPPACLGDGAERDPEALLRCYAPVFVADETEHAYNRIGTPVLTPAWTGGVRLRVDPWAPTMYGEVRTDVMAGRPVLQLVYRVHFEKTPLRLSLHFFEAHRNPGMLAVLTLDEATLEPQFATLVHTCGCYRAVIPTDAVPQAMLPDDWTETKRVYGQTLPGRISVPRPGATRLVVDLEPGGHRVSDVRVEAVPASGGVPIAVRELPELRAMPVAGQGERRASIFYESGPLRGKVRGAWNMFEGLSLGFVTLDPTVGMDKDFGDPEQTGTRFYTMLRPWKRDTSRLDRFDDLLAELGYRMPARAAAAD